MGLFVALVAGTAPVGGQPAPSPALQAFVSSLQRAAAQNDRRAVAGMMRYPLEVTAGGLQIPVDDADAFVRLYDSIMTSGMKASIAQARLPSGGSGPPGTEVQAAGGVTFGDAIVIGPAGGGFRVTRLSVPLSPRAATPGEAVARHLTFRVGSPTQVNGAIDPGGRDSYEFHAVQGAFIDARLTGVRGRTVLLRIVDSGTGTPIDARADAGTRVWRGRVSAKADYRIEVVRQPGSGRETLLYTLSVSLK